MELNDVNYGKISLPIDVAAIVETPLFQRLKCIKQLGFLKIDNVLEYQHTRYTHCIGTYYAAGLMLDALEKNTQWLKDNNNKIPPVFRKSVQIAALLHDIGHGPFSHTWERVVDIYAHERVGFPCVDEIFKHIDEKLFPELRNNNNYGIELIKSLIDGRIENFPYTIPENFKFIFEIVSNKQCQLDVDKWDYLKRDFNHLKHLCSPNMDFDDVFLNARVSSCGQHIEYRYEDYAKIFNLFKARYSFHSNAYSLPQFLICEQLFKLAVHEINPSIDNLHVTAIDSKNCTEFLKLTDNNLFALISESSFSKFLKFETKFMEVNELESCTSSITVDIPRVKKYMPSETGFHFYGDIKDKTTFNDETKKVKKIYKFYCDESTETVYYKVEEIN